MRLTDEEKRILNGERGEIAQRCMKFLVEYGEAAGAEYLVDIDGTVDMHPGANWVPAYSVSREEVAALAARGERFKVPTFSDKATAPGFIVDGWETCGVHPSCEPAFHQKCLDDLKPYIEMGMIPTFSCTHYLVSSFWPAPGTHSAWVESSAIPWVNAVLGSRSNFDGCFQTAYLGKVPAYDMHLTENRAATVLVRCETELKRDMDYDLFGWAVGERLGLKVPALVGIGRPTTAQLVKMNSSLNTGGQVRMYHIPGITPEAPTLEAAFQGKKPREVISITRDDLRRVYDMMNYGSRDDVDFVHLGCPHYTIQEVRKVAELLDGKKCSVRLWVMTSPQVYSLAEAAGYRKKIEAAGGMLLSGACAGLLKGNTMPPANKPSVIATDSAKQDYYITGHCYPEKVQVRYGTMEDCIEAAVTGRWKGEWR
ncbi:MAG: aconitase X catalytic domain-containing protein [Dehalococcoidales bacterium]|nr:aconitase X catalytic domain-containing protein [Dehalococcoidales bacterium]